MRKVGCVVKEQYVTDRCIASCRCTSVCFRNITCLCRRAHVLRTWVFSLLVEMGNLVNAYKRVYIIYMIHIYSAPVRHHYTHAYVHTSTHTDPYIQGYRSLIHTYVRTSYIHTYIHTRLSCMIICIPGQEGCRWLASVAASRHVRALVCMCVSIFNMVTSHVTQRKYCSILYRHTCTHL
jgi:hypothetical protein